MDGVWGYLSYLLLYVGIPGGAAALFGIGVMKYLGDKLVTHRLEQEMEKYKSELSAETEVLKTQLAIYANAEAVSFSRFDAQRSEAVIGVFSKIRAVINSLGSLISGSPLVGATSAANLEYYRTHFEATHKAGEVLAYTLADNAIFFDDPLYAKVAEFAKTSMDVVGNGANLIRRGKAEGESVEFLLSAAEKEASFVKKSFETAIKPTYWGILKEFRMELGMRPLKG